MGLSFLYFWGNYKNKKMILLKGGVIIKASLTIISALIALLIFISIQHNKKRNKLKTLLINQRKFLYAYIRLEDKLINELKNKALSTTDSKTLKLKYRNEVLSETNEFVDIRFPEGTHVENIESQIRKDIGRASE
jgi:hypothetical protein